MMECISMGPHHLNPYRSSVTSAQDNELLPRIQQHLTGTTLSASQHHLRYQHTRKSFAAKDANHLAVTRSLKSQYHWWYEFKEKYLNTMSSLVSRWTAIKDVENINLGIITCAKNILRDIGHLSVEVDRIFEEIHPGISSKKSAVIRGDHCYLNKKPIRILRTTS